MGGLCDGRVVIVTGAGGGIGRSHALAFAAHGAAVVVNDLGTAPDGHGVSDGPAQRVVDEIRALSGEAIANHADVSSFDAAKSLIDQAIETYGRLDVLVNNAGILRDRMLVNMTEDEWDAVVKVHLKGTFGPARHAARYWRERANAGEQVDARLINTTSASGIFGNVGQTNYGAAKAGIAAFTVIAAQELARYGVSVNAIAPNALTRLTEDLALMAPIKADAARSQSLAAHNISPLVVWLGSSFSRGITGRVFGVEGGRITVVEGWANGPSVDHGGRWEASELGEVVPDLVRRAAGNADMSGERSTSQPASLTP